MLILGKTHIITPFASIPVFFSRGHVHLPNGMVRSPMAMGRRNCWESERGLGHLERTLAKRKVLYLVMCTSFYRAGERYYILQCVPYFIVQSTL